MQQQTTLHQRTFRQSTMKSETKTSARSQNLVLSAVPVIKILFDKERKDAEEIVAFTSAKIRLVR